MVHLHVFRWSEKASTTWRAILAELKAISICSFSSHWWDFRTHRTITFRGAPAVEMVPSLFLFNRNFLSKTLQQKISPLYSGCSKVHARDRTETFSGTWQMCSSIVPTEGFPTDFTRESSRADWVQTRGVIMRHEKHDVVQHPPSTPRYLPQCEHRQNVVLVFNAILPWKGKWVQITCKWKGFWIDFCFN